MSTLERGLIRAKKEHVQVHWIVPGFVAKVFNVKHDTQYQLTKEAGTWRCDCIYGRNFARGNAVCKHVASVIRKEIRENLVSEGRSEKQVQHLLAWIKEQEYD